MHIPKVFWTAFFIEQFQWLLLASMRKQFLKISLFHVQMQEPAIRLTAPRAFVFLAEFIIVKYLKQEVNDLSICMDDQKVHRPLSRSCFYSLNLVTIRVPSVTLCMRFTFCPNLVFLASLSQIYRFSDCSVT